MIPAVIHRPGIATPAIPIVAADAGYDLPVDVAVVDPAIAALPVSTQIPDDARAVSAAGTR